MSENDAVENGKNKEILEDDLPKLYTRKKKWRIWPSLQDDFEETKQRR